jgi:hypothetical protein
MEQSQHQVDENLNSMQIITSNNDMDNNDFEDITNQLEKVKISI